MIPRRSFLEVLVGFPFASLFGAGNAILSLQKCFGGETKGIQETRLGIVDRIDTEASILGWMMLDRNLTSRVLTIIGRQGASRFEAPAHRKLFQVLADLYEFIDLVIVKDELDRRDLLESIGGEEYMIDLVQRVCPKEHLEECARVVKNSSCCAG